MSSPFVVIVVCVCLLVLAVLMLGIGSFAKGGRIGKRYSNKLMRLRIILQAVAIILIIIFVYFEKRG